MEASNVSHLPPQHKQLPIWRTATETERRKRRTEAVTKTKRLSLMHTASQAVCQPILPISLYLLGLKSHSLLILDSFDSKDSC